MASTIPRLLYGFLSQSVDPYNLSVPWSISEQDGMFQMNYSLEKAVETNLIVWAKTNWGERPMFFRFGLDAKRYLFENRNLAKMKILDNARDQLAKYFSFLLIEELDIITSDEDNSISDNSIILVLEASFKSNNERKIKISKEIGF